MRIAYADPPYLGCSHLYPEHAESHVWDDPKEHIRLMFEMDSDYDAWALSLHEPSLRVLLPNAPVGVRVGAWVKPFASFKKGVDPAYTWEPVIFKTARKWSREVPTCRDYVATPIALQKGVVGAKPVEFCYWLFHLLGASAGDEFRDIFPGSGVVSRAWSRFVEQPSLLV